MAPMAYAQASDYWGRKEHTQQVWFLRLGSRRQYLSRTFPSFRAYFTYLDVPTTPTEAATLGDAQRHIK